MSRSFESLYSSKEWNYFSNERREMIEFVPNQAKSILEIGCGNGSFGAILKFERNVLYYGVEPSADAAKDASKVLDKVKVGFFSKDMIFERKFDCIIFNDVLEHLEDPWSALKYSTSLLNNNGKVVSSIPNMRYYPVLRGLVKDGTWEYQEKGILDRTHLRFFTKSSMISLMEQSGLKVEICKGINESKFGWKYRIVSRLIPRIFGDTNFLQFAIVASIN